MKILCDRQQLSEVFGVAAGITPLKTPKPIAKNVLLRAEKDGLTLHATDFEMSVRLVLDSVKVNEPGSALVPAKEMAALLREISDPTVTLETDELRCTLKSGGGSFVLVGDEPDQFPVAGDLEKTKGAKSVRIPGNKLLEMLRRTTFAAAREDSRYAINGLLLQCKDSSLRLVATDGRRLAFCYHNFEGEVPDAEMVVSLRALQALARAIPEGGAEEIEIVFGDNQAKFTCPNRRRRRRAGADLAAARQPLPGLRGRDAQGGGHHRGDFPRPAGGQRPPGGGPQCRRAAVWCASSSAVPAWSCRPRAPEWGAPTW